MFVNGGSQMFTFDSWQNMRENCEAIDDSNLGIGMIESIRRRSPIKHPRERPHSRTRCTQKKHSDYQGSVRDGEAGTNSIALNELLMNIQ